MGIIWDLGCAAVLQGLWGFRRMEFVLGGIGGLGTKYLKEDKIGHGLAMEGVRNSHHQDGVVWADT